MPHDAWRPLYPFEPHFAGIGGRRMHYLDEGRGRPLLLVHGNPTWSFYWRELVRGLRDDVRLVAPDHIGCGLSDKPQDYPYVLETHVANLAALVERLDLREITLVAHDWGGAIGLGAAVRAPERFSQFVLMNTAAFRSPRLPTRLRLCRAPFLGPLLVRGMNGFLRAAFRFATEQPELFTPDIRAGYLAPYNTWAHRVAILRFIQDIPLKSSHPSYKTLFEIETGLSVFQSRRVLLLWGMKDWCFTPHFLDRFLEFFPYAEAERYGHAGHFIMEDARLCVMERIRRFLTDGEAAV